MKKIYFVLLGVLWGSLTCIFAEHVPIDKALQVANHFTQQMNAQQLRSGNALQLVYTAQPSLRSAGDPKAYYYVFNIGNKNGFVVISGDDRARPVLGYSTVGDFSYESAPDNLKWWFQEYANQIQFACSNGVAQDFEIRKNWTSLQAGTGLKSLKSEVLLPTADWGQTAPYNDLCPMIGENRAATGCVATAMAIVMKYHNYPAKGTGSFSYTDDYNHSYSANFDTPYDWNLMKNNYFETNTANTPAEMAAVAKLMYHCGVSCKMSYDPDGSFASLGYMPKALSNYFYYNKSITGLVKGGHTEAEWVSLIKKELDNGSPIPYGGQSGNFGHAFVLDGYNNSNQYHVNWGWEGYYNGWFTLNALDLDDQTYSTDQHMVVNIIPEAGGESSNKIIIANYGKFGSEGLKLIESPLQITDFEVGVSTLICEGTNGYEENPFLLYAAHVDAQGNIKDMASNNGYRLNPSVMSYYEILYFQCSIRKKIETGDQLCLVYCEENSDTDEYRIVGGESGLPTRIDLTEKQPVGNEVISAKNVHVEVRGCTLCITHPDVKDVPVYITSFGGILVKVAKLKNGYTEIDLGTEGVYIVSFDGYSQKVITRY